MQEPAIGPVPRQIAKWLDSLDLAYQVRNFRRDLANGFIVAEILSRYYPKEVSIYTYHNANNSEKRKDNWEQIAKVLAKRDYIVKPTDYEPIYNQAPDVAQAFLFKLYEFLTNKKLDQIFPEAGKDVKKGGKQAPTTTVLPRVKPIAPAPSYAKPTAALLAKDREIVRIVEEDQRKAKTVSKINEHDTKQRNDKQDENIIEYLILKRKRQIEEEIRKQEEELIKKQMRFNKKLVNLDQSQQSQGAEIKEISLNCYHSSTSKKAKEQQGQLMETKGVIDFLHENCANLFKKDPIQTDITEFKMEPKEAQQNNGYQSSQQNVTYTNVIQQLFARCDEVKEESLIVLLNNFLDFSFTLIIESLNNNFIDFKRFFKIFMRPLEVMEPTSKPFQLIIELIKHIGMKLVELEPQGTQMMFESILLKDLLNISLKYPNKREFIIQTFYLFGPPSPQSRMHMLECIKTHIKNPLPSFILVLANLIQQPYPQNDEELHSFFKFYAVYALNSPSPLTRTNGLSILCKVANWNYQIVLEKVIDLKRLMRDTWWEVRAMGICIAADLLTLIAEDEVRLQESTKTHQQQHLEDEDQALLDQIQSPPQIANLQYYKEQLLEMVDQIFVVNASQNVIRIGLIYLAPILTKYPELCGRYLEILLSIEPKFRETVLLTNPPQGMEYGQVVGGCNSFKYKLTGAPIVWNSVGIARAMDEYVKANQLAQFDYQHLEIIYACLYNDLQPEDGQVWLSIYENIKNLVFLSLTMADLCQFASEILKKFFMFETIQHQVLENSFKIFLKLLSLVHHPDIQDTCKENLLEFFEFLNEHQQKFQNYCYDIIKQFSEQHKDMFLKSNLVNFMNQLAKEKRRELLGEEVH